MKEEKKQNALPFSEKDIRRVLNSSAGKQLLQLLTSTNADTLSKAAEALKQGDIAQAKELLTPVMERPEASALVNQINRK